MEQNNIDKKTLGMRIRSIRQSLGMTMDEFGSKIDNKAKSGTVANWEMGKNSPNNTRLKKIAELGNVSVSFLLYGEESDPFENFKTNLTKSFTKPIKQATSKMRDDLEHSRSQNHINSINYISNFDFSKLETIDLYTIATFVESLDKAKNDKSFKLFRDTVDYLTDFIDSESDKDDLIQARDKIINELNKYIDSLD